MTARDKPVLIIGGGFSGSMLAARLAERGCASVVIEKSPHKGLGVAYSTAQDAHRLNVRANNMGALADKPGDFAEWLAAHHPDHADPEGFAPRRIYGEYIQHRLTAVDNAHPGMIRWITAKATSLDGKSVGLEDGHTLEGSAVVLASGNPPPRPKNPDDSPCRISDPWASGALSQIKPTDRILILGTGLTMVDVLLSLTAQGWQGTAIALSRRGLAPRAHIYGRHAPATLPQSALTGPLSQRLATVRELAADVDWRDIMDAYRSRTASLWQAATTAEKERFLRHLRPWWDVHRHRIAPDIADQLEALKSQGRLSLHAGRISQITSNSDGLDIRWQPRGSTELQSRTVHWMIDCTGPGHDPARDPLTAPLIASGRLSMDPTGLGLRVAETGQALNTEGVADDSLYVLGPPTRAAFWESIAVPDLRNRIEALVQQLT